MYNKKIYDTLYKIKSSVKFLSYLYFLFLAVYIGAMLYVHIVCQDAGAPAVLTTELSSILKVLFSNLLILDKVSTEFLALATLVEFLIDQTLWIFGLIIGNQLWLKEPKFLWKKSVYLSIVIVVSGFVLSFLSIYRLNF